MKTSWAPVAVATSWASTGEDAISGMTVGPPVSTAANMLGTTRTCQRPRSLSFS